MVQRIAFRAGLAAGGLALAAVLGLGLVPTPAEARVVVGVGIGVPYYDPYFYPPPPVIYAPPPVYVAPPPVMPTYVQPQAQSWYYCDSPQGYYPYVQACSAGWRQVPAQPR